MGSFFSVSRNRNFEMTLSSLRVARDGIQLIILKSRGGLEQLLLNGSCDRPVCRLFGGVEPRRSVAPGEIADIIVGTEYGVPRLLVSCVRVSRERESTPGKGFSLLDESSVKIRAEEISIPCILCCSKTFFFPTQFGDNVYPYSHIPRTRRISRSSR